MTMYEETVGDSLYMYCMTVVTDGKLISLLQGLSASSNFPSCFYRTHFNPKLKWTLVLYSCHYISPDISKTLKSWSTWPATIKLSFGLIRKLSRSSASSWCAQVKGTEKSMSDEKLINNFFEVTNINKVQCKTCLCAFGPVNPSVCAWYNKFLGKKRLSVSWNWRSQVSLTFKPSGNSAYH